MWVFIGMWVPMAPLVGGAMGYIAWVGTVSALFAVLLMLGCSRLYCVSEEVRLDLCFLLMMYRFVML